MFLEHSPQAGEHVVDSVTAPPVVGEPEADSAFTILEVDSAVVRSQSSAAPAYPLDLLTKKVQGSVNARYVVDTTGFADYDVVRGPRGDGRRIRARGARCPAVHALSRRRRSERAKCVRSSRTVVHVQDHAADSYLRRRPSRNAYGTAGSATSARTPIRLCNRSRYVRDSLSFAPLRNTMIASPANHGCTSTIRSTFTM